MSVKANAVSMSVEPFDDETPTEYVTRTFKTTEENKTKRVVISLNDKVDSFIRDVSLRSARWRSHSQFVNDALIYYLNSDEETKPATKIIEESTWNYHDQMCANITETLWNEIDVMVKHGHTPWNTKQEFYTCALFSYIDAGTPTVERR